ncbi:endomucin-like isoform X1 [Dendropsophus ebraccatus]|uniref:endomucin-like isoform X1 n=1 Tax=Dendropsophus ebraccatus TaxID=150705 RepID=UPI003831E7B1
MKSIGADMLSVLILLTALPNNVIGEGESQATTAQSLPTGPLKTSTDSPGTTLAHTTKTANRPTPTIPNQHTTRPSANRPTPTIPNQHTTRASDVTETKLTTTPNPADNQTKNESEAITKVVTTTDQGHHENVSTPAMINVTAITLTHSAPNNTEIIPTDGNMDITSIAGHKNVIETADVSSEKIPTEHKGDGKDKGESEGQQSPSKSKKGIIIGVGCVLGAVVFVVLIFLYKMCQKKPPAAETSEIKVNRSPQTKESVKLLSVKTATPYSDSKRISNQMESIEC